MSAGLVSFVGVGKTYDGETLAVRDLNLEVREGEFLTLLGPSGSGKTTTLLMLAGFETPTSGDILVKGASITRVPPHQRNFGIVFQNYALFPHMSAVENVAFPLAVRGVPKQTALARARRALDLVQLGDLASRRPNQLSGGQQQRTALARALVFEPTLVLMDEPLGALDTKLRVQMQLEIKQIHERLGNTMVSVTHDQSEALTMSDRIAVFNAGRLQQVATPEDLYERPCSSFVARFVGESNRLHGTIQSITGSECLVVLEGGREVTATLGPSARVRERTTLSMRPERLAILNGLSTARRNEFSARIRETVYSGDHVKYAIEILDRSDWLIKISDRSLAARFKKGDEIKVGWDPEDCLALDYLADDIGESSG